MLYELLVRPVLFALSRSDPEVAHELALRLAQSAGDDDEIRPLLSLITRVRHPSLSQSLMGLTFQNPIGLAAGFDKNAEACRGCAALGFGFLEIGTVTRRPQEESPRPRVFRLPKDRALINRMGFNNHGADVVCERLVRSGKPHGVPLGVSIGKSKVTPLTEAAADYAYSLRKFYELGDYFVVNVSSPNTPGLRHLQDKALLRELLAAMTQTARDCAAERRPKPLLVKVSPDLSENAIIELLGVCFDYGVDGVVAVNTTVARNHLRTEINEEGGLSGKPLFRRARDVVRFIRREVDSRMVIVGSGGVFSTSDAYLMMLAGANLVQIYTSLVYRGPFVVRSINRGLVRLLPKEGLKNVGQLNPITRKY